MRSLYHFLFASVFLSGCGGLNSSWFSTVLSGDTVAVKRYLITYPGSIDLEDGHGETALNLAVEREDIAMVQCLILNKASVDHDSPRLKHPLRYAAAFGSPELVKLLIQSGADVNYLPNRVSAQTALHSAAGRGNFEIFSLLLDAGADVHKLTSDGNSVLHFAISSMPPFDDRLKIVNALLEKGADLNAVTSNDLSVLDLAQRLDASIPETLPIRRAIEDAIKSQSLKK